MMMKPVAMMMRIMYLAKEGRGPFCSASFPVGSPPMSDCECP